MRTPEATPEAILKASRPRPPPTTAPLREGRDITSESPEADAGVRGGGGGGGGLDGGRAGADELQSFGIQMFSSATSSTTAASCLLPSLEGLIT